MAWNRFAYVYNNPVNYADPSGHVPVLLAAAYTVVDTAWDIVDVYSDIRDCFGDSDSMACAMLPIDALAVVALFAEGPSNNVARRAAKAADVGDAAGDVARRVDDVSVGTYTPVKFRGNSTYALLNSKGGAGPHRWHRMNADDALRREFNNVVRKRYIMEFGASDEAMELMQRGVFSKSDLRMMIESGVMPSGWDIHHITPLYRGGDNAFSNLIPVKRSFHQRWAGLLHNYDEGFSPERLAPLVRRYGR